VTQVTFLCKVYGAKPFEGSDIYVNVLSFQNSRADGRLINSTLGKLPICPTQVKESIMDKQTITKRYEASPGFIIVVMLVVICVLMSCYMTTLVAYAALDSAEGVLGYRTGSVIPEEPVLDVPLPPTETPHSIEIIPLPTESFSPAATVTITGTEVITP
jgi:hypothetical protein